ncbi:MAG: SDR family NAD(P)-dependent oxidoreductase, partial [Halobacteriales archaeon]
MAVDFDFSGRVAVVTGASGALGSAVARAFDDAGATVAAVDVVEPSADDALLDPGTPAAFYEADLTDEADVEETVAAVVDDYGGVDALCNIAGTWRGGQPIEETGVEEFDLLFDVNLKTMFLASKHAIPHLRERDGPI